MKYKILVSWEMVGEFEVEAGSLEEAIMEVEEDDEKYPIGKADGEYVDGSFKVNMDCTLDVNEEKS